MNESFKINDDKYLTPIHYNSINSRNEIEIYSKNVSLSHLIKRNIIEFNYEVIKNTQTIKLIVTVL